MKVSLTLFHASDCAKTGRNYGTLRWHILNILTKCQVGSQKDLLREYYHLIGK